VCDAIGQGVQSVTVSLRTVTGHGIYCYDDDAVLIDNVAYRPKLSSALKGVCTREVTGRATETDELRACLPDFSTPQPLPPSPFSSSVYLFDAGTSFLTVGHNRIGRGDPIANRPENRARGSAHRKSA
jgi:hypothetical protein